MKQPIYFKDKVAIDPVTKSVNLSRSGIYEYLGREIGLNDENIYKVYRSETTVEKTAKLLNDYGAIPVLINHPKEFVDLKDDVNYKKGGVGNGNVKQVDTGVSVCSGNIVGLTDEIKEFLRKGQEVSLGYTGNIKACGDEDYDFELDIVDINHLAIVSRGRAGSVCSIQDGVNNKQLILQELNNKKENMTMANDNEKIEDENTETEVEDKCGKEMKPGTKAEAKKPDDEEETKKAEAEKKKTEVKGKDGINMVDANLVDEARNEGVKAGIEQTEKMFKNALSLVDSKLIKIEDLSKGSIFELVDNTVLKLLDKEKFENDVERTATINLVVAQLNKKSWNFSDTKGISEDLKYKKGQFISQLFNN